jgi:hypothetical protein
LLEGRVMYIFKTCCSNVLPRCSWFCSACRRLTFAVALSPEMVSRTLDLNALSVRHLFPLIRFSADFILNKLWTIVWKHREYVWTYKAHAKEEVLYNQTTIFLYQHIKMYCDVTERRTFEDKYTHCCRAVDTHRLQFIQVEISVQFHL